jgi:hypothetical protein
MFSAGGKSFLAGVPGGGEQEEPRPPKFAVHALVDGSHQGLLPARTQSLFEARGHRSEKEIIMGVLRVMSRRGDDAVTWEYPGPDVSDLEALAAVYAAECVFDEQAARGATAFRVEQNAAPVRIDHFEVEAEQIVLVPRVAGGS